MSIRVSRMMVLAVTVMLATPAVTGCDKKEDKEEEEEKDDDEEEEEEEEEDDGNVMAGASYKTVPATSIQVPIPEGWATKKHSLYSVAMSPDKKAFVAFTTVSSKGEFVGRIQHAAKTFKVTNYKKTKDVNMKLGPDKLNAFVQDATCSFNNTPGIMSSVLVDTGKRQKVFVVYALDQKASGKTKKQAQGTVLGMRKKR